MHGWSFGRIRLRHKLTLTFAVVLVLVGLQATFTLVLLNQVAQRSAEMASPALNRVDDLAQIEADTLRLRAIEYSLVTSSNERFQQQLVAQMEQLQDVIGQHVSNYAGSQLDPGRTAAFEAIRREYQQYAMSLAATQTAALQGDSNEALWQYLRFQASFSQLDGQLHELRSREYLVAKAVPDQMIGLAIWSRAPVALMVVAIAGAELMLGWYLSRGITRSLDVLECGAQRIAVRNFDERVPPPPEPELAALAGTLNHVMEVLEEHSRMVARLDQERAEAARERINQVLRAQERERSRISRELHDQAGQALTALNYGLSRIQDTMAGTPAAAEVDRLLALAADTGRQIAALARDLRPGVLDDLGLVPALRSYTRDFSDHIGIPVSLSIPRPLPRLSQEVETVVFRVVQEALTNVAKHARASSATVELQVRGAQLAIEITDDGQGFDTRSTPEAVRPALGLVGIRERVELLGGDFELSSQPGRGTQLRAIVPVSAGAGPDRVANLEAVRPAPELVRA